MLRFKFKSSFKGVIINQAIELISSPELCFSILITVLTSIYLLIIIERLYYFCF